MKSQIRADFDMASDKAGILAKGGVIDAFEERVNDSGTTRVRFAQGWVSMQSGKGATVLEPFASPAETAAQAAKVMASAMQSSRVEELQAPQPELVVATRRYNSDGARISEEEWQAQQAAAAPAKAGPPAIPRKRKMTVRIIGIEERSETLAAGASPKKYLLRSILVYNSNWDIPP